MRGTFGGDREAPFGRGLRHAADAVVDDVLGIGTSDRVLIVTNPDAEMTPVAWAVHDAAVAREADTVLVSQPVKDENDMADPVVLRALETDPDVIVVLTNGLLGADPERIHRPIHGTYTHYLQYLVGAGRSRAAWAPGVTRRLFAKAVVVDHEAIAAECRAVLDAAAEAVEIHVTSPGGTELVVPVAPLQATAEDGRYLEPGRAGALPAGEVVLPTAETGAASGTLVIDGLLGLPGHTLWPRKPVTCKVEEGRVTEVTGGDDATALRQALAEGARGAERAVAGGWLTRDQAVVYAANTRRVAEVGIGVNAAVRASGVLPVDQVARGAVRIGIGAARHETPPGAPVALHGLVRKADVMVVLDDGSELALVRSGRAVETPVALAR